MWTCVNCKEIFDSGLEGSMKHPYCKECFKEVWKGNYYDYFIWLNNIHNKQNVH